MADYVKNVSATKSLEMFGAEKKKIVIKCGESGNQSELQKRWTEYWRNYKLFQYTYTLSTGDTTNYFNAETYTLSTGDTTNYFNADKHTLSTGETTNYFTKFTGENSDKLISFHVSM